MSNRNPYAKTKKSPSNPYAKTARSPYASSTPTSSSRPATNDESSTSPLPSTKRQSIDNDCKHSGSFQTPLDPFLEHETQKGSKRGFDDDNDSNVRSEIVQTLQTYFGFSSFRDGQEEVIKSLVTRGQDAAVFWATGQGKSLCFQIPALYLRKTVIVVSPLISLMQDQCAKLNALASANNEPDVATYLGSGQMDPSIESRALNGEFLLVYVTPEKIVNSSFLSRLATLKQSRGIALFAVDEAHCVSQWGHDFRREFLQLGQIRMQPGLEDVPVLTLTATAVPRVQRDIVKSLHLTDPYLSIKTFDRENLIISVNRKPQGSFKEALFPLVDELREASESGTAGQSTIIYSPTKALVDDIAFWLGANLSEHGVKVQPYHAGLSLQQRQSTHTAFLVGSVTAIVATVAFGMGIDKPDTRRVYHWGAPKTVEEYYQQIGRAGRDGLPARCTMWCNDSDFANYHSDFYIGNLDAAAKAATLNSIESLRRFAMDTEACRRAELLRFFNEEPSFGSRCGTCDTCEDAKKFKGDKTRDFFEDCKFLLLALRSLKSPSMSTIDKVIKGNILESYNYKHSPTKTQEAIQTARRDAPRRPAGFWKEFVPALVSRGFFTQNTMKKTVGGYDRVRLFSVYADFIFARGTLLTHLYWLH